MKTDDMFNHLSEIMEKDVDNIEVPESLRPENMRIKLDSMQTRNKKKKNKVTYRGIIGGMAAVAALAIVTVGAMNASKLAKKANPGSDVSEDAIVQIGHSYRLANDYDEIYKKLGEKRKNEVYYEESMPLLNATDTSVSSAKTESSDGSSTTNDSSDYSKTNTMVDSIDEADVVKINDKYLYVLYNNTIEIVDISKTEMDKVGEVKLSEINDVEEFFLSGNRLYVIGGKRSVSLTNAMLNLLGDYYYKEYNNKTFLYSIDVSDPKNPNVLGSMSQDGIYTTSRIAGDYIYLFTMKDVDVEYNKEEVIPKINDEKVAATDIYITNRDYVYTSLIISSVKTDNITEVVDQKVIMDEYVTEYMGESSIYLYGTDYSNGEQQTEIVKFSYKDGKITAVGAGFVKGYVSDTFALCEKNGRLRILTTVRDKNTYLDSGLLTIFDEDMKNVSSIDNIAPGEKVYAARYIGDVVYFVTYRNMDPLFAVDLSDDTNPKMLGFIEMTGYSEYLHPYGKDRLLGIGYETDPDTSVRKGIKLTMFDISDPTKISIIDSVVITDAYWSSAISDYKQVLADSDKNIIGLLTKGQLKADYYVYTWNNNKFEKLMDYEINKTSTNSYYSYYKTVRGLYSGNSLYLIENYSQVKSFDMKNGFVKVSELEL